MNSRKLALDAKSLGGLLLSGLVIERVAVGALAIFKPQLVRSGIGSQDAETGTGRAFIQAFGLRHAALGALLMFAKSRQSLRPTHSQEIDLFLMTALFLNSAVEFGDAMIVQKVSREFPRERRASAHAAWGGLIGGSLCLLTCFLLKREDQLSSPRLFTSTSQA